MTIEQFEHVTDYTCAEKQDFTENEFWTLPKNRSWRNSPLLGQFCEEFLLTVSVPEMGADEVMKRCELENISG